MNAHRFHFTRQSKFRIYLFTLICLFLQTGLLLPRSFRCPRLYDVGVTRRCHCPLGEGAYGRFGQSSRLFA